MTQLFRQEAINNKKYKLSGVVILVQPPLMKSLVWLLLFIVTITLIFLSIGSYTRKETVTGILQPDMGLIRLKAPQSGIILKLLVKEGESVKKGQPLLRIISEKHGVKGFELNESIINQFEFQVATLTQQLTQQESKKELEKQSLKDRLNSRVKRFSQLDMQSKIFDKRLKLNQEIVAQVSSLAGTGYISDIDLKKQEDSLLALDQQSAAINAEKIAMKSEIKQIKNDLSQLPIIQGLAEDLLKTQLTQVASQLSTIKQQRLSELRSPADGRITGLLAKQGKSVINEQKLLSILPKNSQMQAIIYLPTSAFGFIEKGQITQLRYQAFPYQRFGVYQGHISEISSNVILPSETDIPGLITKPSYRIVATLTQQNIQAYGRDMPLRSGMKLDADIVIEERSLMHWLFDPVLSLKGKL